MSRTITHANRRSASRFPGLARTFLLLSAAAVVVLGAACVDTDQRNALGVLNTDRSAGRLASLAANSSAQVSAQTHAERLAKSGSLYHSSLRLARGECAKAENVGYGPSIAAVEKMFMRSAQHRANILNPRYDEVGIGVVRKGSLVWVVQVFVDRC